MWSAATCRPGRAASSDVQKDERSSELRVERGTPVGSALSLNSQLFDGDKSPAKSADKSAQSKLVAASLQGDGSE